MLQAMADEDFLSRLIFSDESSYHLSGKVNRHNVCIWGLENPHETLQHGRDSPKVNVFCAMSVRQVYVPFFFPEKTVNGIAYLRVLQNWLFPQLQNIIFQQDGAPPHFLNDMRNG
jgi:hypothetical protein